MKVVCIRTAEGTIGHSMIQWCDYVFPIKDLVYDVIKTRTDCEGDIGYMLHGLEGWWTHDLFRKLEQTDMKYESIESLCESICCDLTCGEADHRK